MSVVAWALSSPSEVPENGCLPSELEVEPILIMPDVQSHHKTCELLLLFYHFIIINYHYYYSFLFPTFTSSSLAHENTIQNDCSGVRHGIAHSRKRRYQRNNPSQNTTKVQLGLTRARHGYI